VGREREQATLAGAKKRLTKLIFRTLTKHSYFRICGSALPAAPRLLGLSGFRTLFVLCIVFYIIAFLLCTLCCVFTTQSGELRSRHARCAGSKAN